MANLSSTRIFGDGTVERNLYVKQRLGVGVGSPDYAVDVFGDIRLNADGSSNGKAQVRFNEGSGTNAYIGYDGNNLGGGDNRLEFNCNGTHMVVENRGRVGIGTTSPEEALDVRGNKIQLVNSSTSGSSQIHFGDPDDVNVGRIKYEHSADSMEFETNAQGTQVTIDSGGTIQSAGIDIEGGDPGHINRDGAFYRTGGQAWITVDDNLYIRDQGNGGNSTFAFEVDEERFYLGNNKSAPALSEDKNSSGNLQVGNGSNGYAEVEAQDYYIHEDNLWLGDHVDDSNAHHSRYGDGEAVTAVENAIGSNNFRAQPDSSGGTAAIRFRSNVNAGSDFGLLKWYDDNATYGTGSGDEVGVLAMETENDDPGSGIGDHVALIPTGHIYLDTPYEVRVGNSSSYNVSLNSNGDGYFAGNVGIGTTSPSNDLDINTSGTDSGISFGGSEALTGTTGNGWLRLNQNNNFSNGVYTPGPIRADGNGSGRAGEFRDDVDMSGNDINNVGNINVNETIGLPSGNSAERPNNPVLGMLRYNTEIEVIEVYNGEEWVVISDVSGEDSLYEFTEATFTPGGSTGRLGPSLTEARSGLSGPEVVNWKNNISFFNVSGGIQEWTVPADSNYKIRVEGAAGQNTNDVFGSGAILEAEFQLSAGSKLRILCGQRSVYAGTRDWQGGSGGTFVTTENNEPLIIAGGGGTTRSSTTNFSELDANTGTSGKDGSGTLGGTNGGAGQPGGHNQDASGGAAGFNEDGQSHTDRRNVRPGDPDPFPPARAFVNGGEGGFFATAYEDNNNSLHGGFGGGGSGGWGGAGGGGGYSGGGDCDNSDYSGGGGSFISSSASNAGTSDGSFSTTGSEPTPAYVGSVSNIGSFNDNNQGSVTITKLV